MTADLHTTNIFLGIIAVVTLLEGIAVLGAFAGAFLFHRRVMSVLAGIEERLVDPASARVSAILDDVKAVTTRVNVESGRFEQLIAWVSSRCGCDRKAA
jgi:hypothetical protein